MSRNNKPGKQSLKGEVRSRALAGLTDNDSRRTYRGGIDSFFAWLRPEGAPERYTPAELRGDARPALQAYTESLSEAGKSAATIHTYLAPVCKGFGIAMEEIRKPTREAARITRSREMSPERRDRSAEEIKSGRYAASVDLQNGLGLRRAELGRLTPESLRSDARGMYVVVQGKGGKLQEQRVLPQDEARVREAFDRGLPGRRLFAPSDLGRHIDYHAMRAEHAREAYRYYLAECQKPGGREELQQALRDTLERLHPFRDATDKERVQKEFESDLTRGDGVYALRGDLRKLAIEHGRPTEYDRTALMAVSVWHLAHWRNEVTVSHYMV